MKFEIKNRFDGSLIFELECGSMRLCVEAAIVANADLTSANLRSANLTYADLTSANLRSADLTYANLTYANLTYANLRSANLDLAKLETGETFGEYKSTVMPALCVAGGHTLEEVAAAWECHEWANCPMRVAFDFDGEFENEETPALVKLFRPRIEQFVRLFDAKLLPCPVAVPTSCSASQPTTEGGAG